VQIEYLDIGDITPYERNPRDNAEAVDSVAASIESFGFLVPIIVDPENVIIAGHTRLEAAISVGLTEVPCIRTSRLTEAQINAFRIIDNKVAELARWDFDLLSGEITALRDTGIDFTNFGFTQEEIDCLSEVVADDCLAAGAMVDDDRSGVAERRAPSQTRFVLGEFVFFIPAEDYRRWAAMIRNENDFAEEDITADLQQRLGVTPFLT
jgi:site-specific DNA-methyltransferase (adenine-specific)